MAQTFGCCRLVYNGFLAARKLAFERGEKLGFAGTSARLTVLRKDPELSFLNDICRVPLVQSLRNLELAYKNFFRKQSSYPTFKKKGKSRDAATYVGDSFRFDLQTQRLKVAKIGYLELKISRRVPCHPSSITVSRHSSGRFYVSMLVDVPIPSRTKTGQSIGIDFGLSRLATLSNGETISNSRHLERRRILLARAQKRLARKQKGSNRRYRQVRRVARLHEKIADARRDSLHKLTTSLVRRFDFIYVEDLCIQGMVKNHNLARSLSDAAIGTAIRMLESKAVAVDVSVIKIDRWFPSSKQCSSCGHLLESLSLNVRQWACPICGEQHDRDVNAAKNILAVGQTVTARGAEVSTVRTPVRKAIRRRSVNHLSGDSSVSREDLAGKPGEDVNRQRGGMR